MKKVFTVFALCAIAGSTMAQKKSNNGFKFGAQLGVIEGSAKQEAPLMGSTPTDLGSVGKVGFKVGLTGSLKLSDKISFNPEINFLNHAVGSDVAIMGVNQKTTTTTNSIEVPLNISYDFGTDSKGFFAGVGPTLAYGIFGKVKTTLGSAPEQSTDIKFDGAKNTTDNNIHLKAFNLGANIFVGYKLQDNLNVKLSFNQGLTNLTPEDNSTFKPSYIGLSVGYNF